MKASLLRRITFFIGILNILIPLFFGIGITIYLVPLYISCLYLIYYTSVKKHNILLILFLLVTCIAESIASFGFVDNFMWIASLFTVFFLLGTLLLRPALKRWKIRLKLDEKIGLIVGFICVVFVMVVTYNATIDQVPQTVYHLFAFLAFALFLYACFFVFIYDHHSRGIFTFITGIAYVCMYVNYFIYEFFYNSILLLVLVQACEVVGQYAFVVYLEKRDTAFIDLR
ncbi:hypothetical protein [Marixanthomonas ophiurae]|uniref:Uncharacterized protein n=1 Tax=Marixanthomonas ophiurae TaxID=387659 RepID=A0A3E1Q9B9_9FLAO|nr:hypothetical protein [Marixanthomonas ophiurae]RFN58725.1 hypothetical protein DZ858_01195 [Marixanthomonas ophiurae]